MAKSERSAGFIVYVDPHDGHAEREFLLLDTGRFWDFPKGHVEKGEDDLAAAKRELAEEAGIDNVELVPGFVHEIEYFFRGKGGLIHKTVIYYLGRASGREATISHEHVGSEFLTGEQAIKRVTYPTAKQVLREAIAFLNAKEGP